MTIDGALLGLWIVGLATGVRRRVRKKILSRVAQSQVDKVQLGIKLGSYLEIVNRRWSDSTLILGGGLLVRESQ